VIHTLLAFSSRFVSLADANETLAASLACSLKVITL
jgi:hypothetical protein